MAHRLLPIALLISLASLAVACGPVPDPDGDDQRGLAQPMPLGAVVTDRLAADAGDLTDWKMFAVPAEGFLTLQTHWDRSAEVHGATITVVDVFGTPLQTRRHEPGVALDELVVRVERDTYFVRLELERGSSIYSVIARHQVVATGDDSNGGGIVRPDLQ